jgi:hypothetical protein
MTAGKPEPPEILSGYLGWITNKLGVHPWGQVLILALLACFGLTYRALDKIDDRLHDIDIKMAVMPLDISKGLLAQAQTDVKLGEFSRASKLTETAASIIAKASVEKLPAPSDYFKDVIPRHLQSGEHCTLTYSSRAALYDTARIVVSMGVRM